MLYVYALVDSDRFETIPGEGHDGTDIVAVPCRAFAAAVSRLSACTIEATPQNVWRHERVLERLMRDHVVLPLRFGTICRDAAALRESLPTSADGHRGDFERVRGKVEIALRIVDRAPGLQTAMTIVTDAADDRKPAGRGTAYLHTKLQRLHSDMASKASGKRLERLLRRHFDAVSMDVVCASPADAPAGYLVSCLVERNRVAAFADALDRFRRDHPRFDVTCSGPWAPYSFVSAPAAPGRAA